MSAGRDIDYRLFCHRRKTMNPLNRRTLVRLLTASLSLALLVSAPLVRAAADEAPDALIKRVSAEVLDSIKSDKAVQAGDMSKVIALVDSKVMPNVNFTRMTASAVGRNWRQATPEQKTRLQQEFKTLLIRTYSGALSQVKDQRLSVKPLRAADADTEVVVRTEVLGRGDPVQLDYRMEKTASGWKIYDLNVLGVWLVETYRTQFAQEIGAKGVDGLIASLVQRNKSNAGEPKPEPKPEQKS
jgi:phospholipid transport system substrate-binding protein